MKRLMLIATLLLAATSALALDGAWTATRSDKNPDKYYLNITTGNHSQNGSTYTLSELGLTAAQVQSATQTPVTFQFKREAGTITFEGVFKNGNGAGQMSFAPNRNYINAVKALGIEWDLGTSKKRSRERSDEEHLYALAMHDVSTDYIRSIQAAGYRFPSLEKYMTMAIFDVTPEYINEMRSLGYENLSADKLVETRIHRVTPAYIREMRAAGWNLSLQDFIQSRIFKVTPEFAKEMAQLGYGNLDHDDLVAFRIHKVTPEFIRELATLGYRNVDDDDLVAMRIHRVTPEFIKELADAGYKNVPVRKLVEMRIHNIDPEFVKRMNKVQ